MNRSLYIVLIFAWLSSFLPEEVYFLPASPLSGTYTVVGSETIPSNYTINADGKIIIPTGATLNGGSYHIYNNGTIEITGGNLVISASKYLYNGYAGAATGNVIMYSGIANINGFFRNAQGVGSEGNFIINGGTWNNNSGCSFWNAYGTNSIGNITLSGGNFNLIGTALMWNGNGSDALGTITIYGGTFNVQDSSELYLSRGCSGVINVWGGTFLFQGNIIRHGITPDATLNIGSGSFEVSGGTFQNGSGADDPTAADGTITLTGGTMTISGGNFCNGYWDGGAYQSTGTLNVSGGTLNLQAGTITNGYVSGGTGNINITGGSVNLDVASIEKGFGTSNINFFGVDLSGLEDPLPSGALSISSDQTMTIPDASTFAVGTGSITSEGEISVGGTLSNDNTIENGGRLTNLGAITNNGTLTNDETILNFGTLTNNPSKTITNNGYVIIFEDGTFSNNGTLDGTGTLVDFNQEEPLVLPENYTLTIPPGATMKVSDGKEVSLPARLINQSSNSINIYGHVYTYSIIENGDAGNSGTINVNYPGSLYLLGGTLTNSHVDSEVNINSGGSLYNYYGIVDLVTGGADSLNVKAGGKFHNVRGNNPGTFTLNAGCKFLDTTRISLDKDLDIDFTWTITQQAIIKGNGNKVSFGPKGEIIINGSDAALLIDDVIVENVSGNKIRCTDDSTTLSIHNVAWIQDSSFSFTKGKMYVTGAWLISSDDTTFGYSSDQISTIDSNAMVELINTTLEYDATSPTNIIMTDNTAILHLNQGTLLATQNWKLANGTLLTTGNATLNGNSTLNLLDINGILTNSAPIHIGNVLV